MAVIPRILNNKAWLLLLAGIALVGFIFLIEALGSVASSGPEDLFAPASTDAARIALPGVGGAFSVVLAAVSVIVPLIGMVAFRHRILEGGLSFNNRTLVVASLVGILVAASGIIVAFSGLLNPEIESGQHQAIGRFVDPKGVVVLSIFFLSVALVGIMRPQFLLVVLVGWLLFGLLTAFFGVFGAASDEEPGLGLDYLVLMVLIGYIVTLPVALALGGGKLLIGHLFVFIAVGFVFAYSGQDRFDHLAPGAEFSTDPVPGAVGVPITPLLVLVALTIATGSVCVAIIATYSFLRDSRSRQIEALPAWTAITRWTIGPLALGILYSQFISPGMAGLELVNGPEEIRQSGNSSRDYRERLKPIAHVSRLDETGGLSQGAGGPVISQASTGPAEGSTNQGNSGSTNDAGASNTSAEEQGKVLDVSDELITSVWVWITIALIVAVTLAYAGVRLDFFRWPRAASLFQRVRGGDDPRSGEQQTIEGALSATGRRLQPATPAGSPGVVISFDKPADDLPDVWGLGEQVNTRILLQTESGEVIPQGSVVAMEPGGDDLQLRTDQEGTCAFAWTANETGQFTVAATFEGDAENDRMANVRSLRIVDFREEIVRLYNDFVDWTERQAPGATGRTPRELESILMTHGLVPDDRAMDEIILRFEEADYSQHSIGRSQYEAMYRHCNRVVGA